MAAKRKWYKGWKTVAGSIIGGVAVFVANLPGEIVVGSIQGVHITLGAVLGALGVSLAGTGVAGKLEGLKQGE